MVRIVLAVVESKPEVGSSKKSTLGSLRSCIAIERRRFSPPDIPFRIEDPITVSAHSNNPTFLINDIIMEGILSWFSSGSLKRAWKKRVSRTVKVGIRESSLWST